MNGFDDFHYFSNSNNRRMYEGRINFSMIDTYNRRRLLEAIVHYSTKRFNERICYDPAFPSKLLLHLGLTADQLLTFFNEEVVVMFERFIVAGRLSRKEIPLPPEALGIVENKNLCLFTNRARIESIVFAIAKNTLMNSEADLVPLQHLNTVFKALSIKSSILETKLGKAEKQYCQLYHSIKDKYSLLLKQMNDIPYINSNEMVVNNSNNNIPQQNFLNIPPGHEFNNKLKYPDQESLFLPTIAEDNINGFTMHLLLQVFKWKPSKENFIVDNNGIKIDYPPIIKHIKSQYGNIHRFYNAAYSDEAAAIKYMSQIDFDWNHPNNERYIRSKLAIVDQSAIINYIWAASAVAGLANVQLKKGIKVFWQFKIFGKRDCTSIMFGIASENSYIWNYDDITDLIGIDHLSWGINHKGYAIHNGIKKGVTKSFPRNWIGEHVGLLFNGFGKYGTLTYFLRGQNMGVIFDNIPLNTTYYPAISSTGQFTEFKVNKCLQSHSAVPELKKIVRVKILDFICTPANIDRLSITEHEKSKLKYMWDEDELLHDYISGHTHHYPNFRQ
ncbi:GH26238p2 [Strongyloides ratti]|uniref:GH26238p2 n=1 Tax=Strongyloides ratti TaxID=34506 RepID=A0A090LP48_STRRB|nr:GH26238p2 [Strongyloides ratti]CEF71531.1 GH26238p2 [Strongyloides ratti]